jgi:tetratricopeptide (TPR) repeat protein
MSRRALVAFAIVLGMGGSAVADDANNKKRAQELATESAAHYKRGEFEISVALLRQAYGLYPEPNLQYNLGRSLESLGDAKGAIEAYENYLANGKNIEDRGAIERRVATLKADLADKEKRDKPPVVNPPLADKPPVVTDKPDKQADMMPPPPPVDESSPSVLPWVPIGLGVGAIGAGAYLGHLATSRHDAAVAAATGEDAQRLQNEGHDFATYANVAFAVGAVAVAIGVVWEISVHHSAHHATGVGMRARLAPTSVSLEWTLP